MQKVWTVALYPKGPKKMPGTRLASCHSLIGPRLCLPAAAGGGGGCNKASVGVLVGTSRCTHWFVLLAKNCLHCLFQATEGKRFCVVRVGPLSLYRRRAPLASPEWRGITQRLSYHSTTSSSSSPVLVPVSVYVFLLIYQEPTHQPIIGHYHLQICSNSASNDEEITALGYKPSIKLLP